MVGAGMSGICMAAKLRAAGYDDIVIFEKAAEVGGTWRENRYPGLTCDVPARYYSYKFAPNPEWSGLFAPGAEILDYFVGVTKELDLRRQVRFGSEVTEARWKSGRWHLITADGHKDAVDILITATGFLHHPAFPSIPGLDAFGGRTVHSAQWDPSVQTTGKRVGLIGTGSTGAQITAALADDVTKLSVFQRTPQWVMWAPSFSYHPVSKFLLRKFPALSKVSYRGWQTTLEATLGQAAIKEGWQRTLMSAAARLSLRFGVKDKALRETLTPDYQPLCKRLVISSKFYGAVQSDRVDLVTEGIDHIEERGVVTADGTLHELDVLVLATGFDAHAYMRPMQIEGDSGTTLDEAWAEGPVGYRTVAMSGFPNLFTLVGPHSPVGNYAITGVADAQSDYVMRWVTLIDRNGFASVTPTQDATDRFNEERRAATPGLVAASGCQSWYLGKDGRPDMWPWSPAKHREMLREPVLADFHVELLADASTDSITDKD
ncbi:flavin-containing monooxygenase [Mycobacteroides stephanolepidis]|uniref:flavin-containing monooxygenase n=1 Tax=[Mycobacterium] stephanolepidis TaxID=1520670 RepID=UPI0022B2621E|nr:NAD(P)/FAD-dependent oxidoreductase [[Mycobacterium] stephanolepidis]